jgi:hypothetical protein
MRSQRGAIALPVAAVLAAAIALWLASGVEVSEIARYLGYEAIFVLAPGLLVFRAISPGTRSLLAQVAIGWPLGLVAEIAFYSLTASLDVRAAFFAYPVIIGLGALALRRRRERDRPVRSEPEPEPDREVGPGTPRLGPAQRWSLAGLCALAIAYVGFTLVAYSPLPGSVPNVLYIEDLLFHMSVAAEAQQHWPVETPQISGVVLHYHYLAHLHLAAIGDVTGIEMPVIVLRLWVVPVLCLLLLQLAAVGRAIAGSAWAGPVTAALFLLVWELDLVTPQLAPFLSINQILAWGSPSYLLGLVLFVPLMGLIAGLLAPAIRERLGGAMSARSAWTAVVILALGAAGAKVVALPLLCAGLAACIAMGLLRRRDLQPVAARCLALLAGVFLVAVFALYGTDGGGMRLGAGGNYELVPALVQLRDSFGDSFGAELLFWGLGSVLCTILLLAAPLLGLVFYFRRGGRLGDVEAFLLGMTLAGVLAFVFLEHDVGASFYFLFYGVVAASPLAAAGLCRLAGGWLSERGGPRRSEVLVLALAPCAVAVVAYWSWQVALDAKPVQAYEVAYFALGAGAILLAGWCLIGSTERRPARVAAALLAVVAAAGLDLFIDTAPETLRKVSDGETLYDSVNYGTKSDAYDAAVWARDNLDHDAVLTISNQGTERSQLRASLTTEFPAFAERRAFNEGWAFAVKASEVDREKVVFGDAHPYPERRALEEDLFERADPVAVRTMMDDYGVTHLVVDREDGAVDPGAYEFGRIVYSNDTIDLIELRRPGSGA